MKILEETGGSLIHFVLQIKQIQACAGIWRLCLHKVKRILKDYESPYIRKTRFNFRKLYFQAKKYFFTLNFNFTKHN